MADTPATTFEAKLARLEEIVRLLEGDAVPLQDSVAYFNEGRALAQACEAMLRDAQEAIERTPSDGTAPAPEPAPSRSSGTESANGSLFDDDALA
jgi:exodeoxyribonuclease VII small subunit